MFVRAYGYTITEHDVEKPWLIVSREHRTVELEEGESFALWSAQHWPAPRFTVELDPGQMAPVWR